VNSTATSPPRGPRLDNIDAVRGLVMVLMALDHVRDILQTTTLDVAQATDLHRTYPILFFTRWITHLCAPTFIFLAGVGICLGLQRKSTSEMTWFLITRGLWLVFLEVFIVSYAWFPYSDFRFIPCSVLWAIGWSMIAMAALIWLPRWLIAALAVAIICGHNLTDPLDVTNWGQETWYWQWLHSGGPIEVTKYTTLNMSYPILAWIGVMAAGYSMGPLFYRADRRWLFTVIGLTCIAAYLILRMMNGYGDPRPWVIPSRPAFTPLSCLDCTKYPPSLSYLLMTFGPMFLLLAAFDRTPGPFENWLIVYGRVPMFYYLIHLPLIEFFALSMLLIGWWQGWYTNGAIVGEFLTRNLGLSLAGSYLIWIIVLALLYYPCKWFGELKRQSKSAWLSYL